MGLTRTSPFWPAFTSRKTPTLPGNSGRPKRTTPLTLSVAPMMCGSSLLDGGEVAAEPNKINTINTPVTGWIYCNNTLAAAVGSTTETDAEYRERQEASLGRAGSTNPDAIQAALLAVEGVTSATVTENDTINTVDGLPPKSFEAVIADGDPSLADDTSIAQAIWDTKAAGIETFGTESGNAVDSGGNVRVMNFTRVTEVLLWVEVDVEVDLEYSGDTAVEDAISAVLLKVGQDVTASQVTGLLFRDVPGVRDVTEVRVGLAASPPYTPRLVIAPDERGQLRSGSGSGNLFTMGR